MKYIVRIGERTFEVEIVSQDEVIVDGRRMRVDFHPVAGHPVYSLILDGQSFEALMNPGETEVEVVVRGHHYQVTVEDERQRRLREGIGAPPGHVEETLIKAPMPGMILAIPVEEGQEVAKGQTLVILESMKMQNELKAPRPGKVTRVRASAGDRVEQNQALVIME